jgi:hypothetical protein
VTLNEGTGQGEVKVLGRQGGTDGYCLPVGTAVVTQADHVRTGGQPQELVVAIGIRRHHQGDVLIGGTEAMNVDVQAGNRVAGSVRDAARDAAQRGQHDGVGN